MRKIEFLAAALAVATSFVVPGFSQTLGEVTGRVNDPSGAGVAGSAFGQQITNDFDLGQEYDGPCPPAGLAPDQHRYVFTDDHAGQVVLQEIPEIGPALEIRRLQQRGCQ